MGFDWLALRYEAGLPASTSQLIHCSMYIRRP